MDLILLFLIFIIIALLYLAYTVDKCMKRIDNLYNGHLESLDTSLTLDSDYSKSINSSCNKNNLTVTNLQILGQLTVGNNNFKVDRNGNVTITNQLSIGNGFKVDNKGSVSANKLNINNNVKIDDNGIITTSIKRDDDYWSYKHKANTPLP